MGPETTKDLGGWPLFYIDALEKSGLLENIARLFRHGGLAATDFSGLDAPAAGWAALRDDLHERVGWKQGEMLGWVRSCDNSDVARGVLETMSAGSACVLNDVIERLAPEGQEWLRMQMIAFETFSRESPQWHSACQHQVVPGMNLELCLTFRCSSSHRTRTQGSSHSAALRP